MDKVDCRMAGVVNDERMYNDLVFKLEVAEKLRDTSDQIIQSLNDFINEFPKVSLQPWKPLIIAVNENNPTIACRLYQLRKEYMDYLLSACGTIHETNVCKAHNGSVVLTSDIDVVINVFSVPIKERLQEQLVKNFKSLDTRTYTINAILDINFYVGKFDTCGPPSNTNHFQRNVAFDEWKDIKNCFVLPVDQGKPDDQYIKSALLNIFCTKDKKQNCMYAVKPCSVHEKFKSSTMDESINSISSFKQTEDDSYHTYGSYTRWVTFGTHLSDYTDLEKIPMYTLIDCFIEQLCKARNSFLKKDNASVMKYMSRAVNTHPVFKTAFKFKDVIKITDDNERIINFLTAKSNLTCSLDTSRHQSTKNSQTSTDCPPILDTCSDTLFCSFLKEKRITNLEFETYLKQAMHAGISKARSDINADYINITYQDLTKMSGGAIRRAKKTPTPTPPSIQPLKASKRASKVVKRVSNSLRTCTKRPAKLP